MGARCGEGRGTSNILTEQEVETTADRHLSAQVVPLANVFSFPSAPPQET